MICGQVLFREVWDGADRLLCSRPVIAVFLKMVFMESSLQVPDHSLSERFLLFLHKI